MPKQATRLALQKTYKLFIDGKFLRGESGQIMAARNAEGKCWRITVAHHERIFVMP